MYGEAIALLTTLCWSIGIFPFTEAARRFGTAALNQYRLLLAWLIISAILIFYYGFSPLGLFTRPGFYHFMYLGLSGIVGFTIGDYFSFASFKMLGPKLGSLYTTFAPGAALVVGFLVLGQTINAVGMAGMLVTVSGVIWLTLSKSDGRSSKQAGFARDRRGVLYGILGALCQGSGLVLSKLGLDYYAQRLPTMHAVWIRLLFAFGAAFVVSVLGRRFWANTRPVLTNQGNGLIYMLLGTLFGPVAGVSLSLLAIQHLHVAVAQTIFALLPVMVLPLNYLFYKEKISAVALLSCCVALVGVLLLIWRDRIAAFF